MSRPEPLLRMPRWARIVTAAAALVVGCTPTEPAAEALGPAHATDAQDGDVEVSDEPVRIKGLAPRLLVHRQRQGVIEQLRDGDVARAGDLVQISYVAAGNRNGVILSLDGRGVVTLHHPARPDATPTLVARGQHALDHAYELDDARSYERFVLVTAGDEPLSVTAVLDAAQRLAKRGEAGRHSPLPLPDRWQQTSVTLRKRPQR